MFKSHGHPVGPGWPPPRIFSASHVAFALAFRPGQRLFHCFALVVAQAHLCANGLRIDLLGGLWGGRGGGGRQRLVVVRGWVVVEGSLWWGVFSPRGSRGG